MVKTPLGTPELPGGAHLNKEQLLHPRIENLMGEGVESVTRLLQPLPLLCLGRHADLHQLLKFPALLDEPDLLL